MNATCPCCGSSFFRAPHQPWRELCFSCYRVKKQSGMAGLLDAYRARVVGTQAASAIPADMLRRLLQLAHPDRHGGSEASQIATRWLLEQRGRT